MGALRHFMLGVLSGMLLLCIGAVGRGEGNSGEDDGTPSGTMSCQQKSSLPGYSCQASVRAGVYDLHWAMTADKIAYAIDVKTSGWVAVGWSPTLQMYHADAVVGHTAVGGGSVAPYQLGIGDSVESVLGPTTTFTVENTSSEWRNSRTIVRFTRLMSTGNNPIAANGLNPMIASWSADGSTRLAFHVNNYETFTLDLTTTPILNDMPAEVSATGGTGADPSTGCTASNIVGYNCSLMAGQGVEIHWRLERTKVALAIVAQTTGWVGLGWAKGGSMIGAEVVIWKGSGIPRPYKILGLDPSKINPSTSFRIINQAVNTTATTTTLSFERERDDVGTIPWSPTDLTSMIWAHSGDGTSTFQNHGPSNRAAFDINYNGSSGSGNGTAAPASLTPSSFVPPPSTGCLASTLSGFRCMKVIREDAFVMHWATTSTGVTIVINSSSSSWVSLGWSKEGLMKDTDAVVASDNGRGMQLSTYALTGTGSSSVQPTNRFQIFDAQINVTDGWRLIRFTRMYGDQGVSPAKRSGNNILVWASGSSASLEYHGSRRGTLMVDFESGDASFTKSGGVGDQRTLFNIHAWLMWLAFGLLFPIGIFFARFGQFPSFTPHWFYAHVGIQSTAAVLAAAAFIIALSSFEDAGWHGTLGKLVAALVLAQTLLGVFRVQKHSPKRPLWYLSHWGLGIFTLLVAFLTVFLGIDRYNNRYTISAKNWRTAFGFNVGLFIAAYIVLSLVFGVSPKAKAGEGPVQLVQVVTTNVPVSARTSVDSTGPLNRLDSDSSLKN